MQDRKLKDRKMQGRKMPNKSHFVSGVAICKMQNILSITVL